MKLRVRGRVFNITKKEVEQKLTRIEPEPGVKYFVVIKGKEYPIKQVVDKAFSLSRADFVTQEAYRILRRLGFKIVER